jgi:hypothetical protein
VRVHLWMKTTFLISASRARFCLEHKQFCKIPLISSQILGCVQQLEPPSSVLLNPHRLFRMSSRRRQQRQHEDDASEDASTTGSDEDSEVDNEEEHYNTKSTTPVEQSAQSVSAASGDTEPDKPGSPDADGQDKARGKQETKRSDPTYVPRTGRFFLHDQRDASSKEQKRKPSRKASGGNEDMWLHDKFDEDTDSKNNSKTGRSSRKKQIGNNSGSNSMRQPTQTLPIAVHPAAVPAKSAEHNLPLVPPAKFTECSYPAPATSVSVSRSGPGGKKVEKNTKLTERPQQSTPRGGGKFSNSRSTLNSKSGTAPVEPAESSQVGTGAVAAVSDLTASSATDTVQPRESEQQSPTNRPLRAKAKEFQPQLHAFPNQSSVAFVGIPEMPKSPDWPLPVASQAPWPYGQPLSMPGYYPVDVSQPPVGMALLMSPATMYPPTAMDDPNFGMASMPTFTPTFQAPPPPSDPSEWYNVVPPQQWAYGPPPGNIPLSHEPIAQLPAQSSGSLLSSSALDANAKEFNPKLQVN